MAQKTDPAGWSPETYSGCTTTRRYTRDRRGLSIFNSDFFLIHSLLERRCDAQLELIVAPCSYTIRGVRGFCVF